jgi:hypothetical protein
MVPAGDIEHFVTALSQQNLTELDMALAILWHEDYCSAGSELSTKTIAHQLTSSGLTGIINVARLGQKLTKSRDTLKGIKSGTFRIALKQKAKLDERYLPLLRQRRVQVSDDILPESQTKGTRGYIEKLALQINGTFEFGFYDACAVLCRRLVESMLVEAFDRAGHRVMIERNGDLMGLDDILKQAKGGQFIKLPRGTPQTLEKVKEVGDTAAHDRYHITTEQDIAEFRSGFRKAVSQLMGLAGISPTK